MDTSVWQPKLDVLTARFDALDLVNALDQELVDEFVEQLSAGGDAFALIDSKVLVEKTRALAAEQANLGAIAAEISAREADVDAEAAAALGARATIQAEVDQNEADIAQERVDRVADVNTEETRAQGVESTNATAILTETNDRIAAVSAEVTARNGAIATAVSAEASARGTAITTAVDALVDSAPGTLNTLNELAAALNDDDDYHVAITTALTGKQGQSAYLDVVDSAQRSLVQLQSLDTTTSIATHLSDEEARALAAEAVNAGLVGSEEVRALAAEAVNAGLVSSEEVRALAAEAVNAGLVATEQTRAQGVESTNATAISSESATRATAVSGVQSDLTAVELVLGDRTAVQIARVDATGPIQAQIDSKAADAAVVKKTGNQTISQNGTAAVLVLTNTNSDAPILTCIGGDGEIKLSGGNVLECDRPGSMYVRASDGTGNVTIQSRGSSKVVCDDKVRLKVEVSAEKDFSVENAKKVKFVEASVNGSHAVSLRAPDSVLADVDFELPAADGTAGQVLKTDGNGALSFVTAGGLSAAGNEVITGNWTFEEAVVFEEPLLRMPMVEITTAHNSGTTPTKYPVTIEHSAYLYNLPGTNTDWILPTNAPQGTRLALFNYTGTASNGKINLFTAVGQTLFAVNGTVDKGQSGYASKTNGKMYATMIKAGVSGGIWTV
ncbi:MAG: hypothetical protein ABGY43_01985 [bacterium]